MKRQNIRRALLIAALLLFPVTIYYFSPYLIMMGALEGVISGSFITFIVMIFAGIIFGRGFCAYLCPLGGLQECLFDANDKPVSSKVNKVRYVIWVVWLCAVIACFVIHGKVNKVDPLFETDHGISMSHISAYIVYYLVVGLAVIISLTLGKRGFCHSVCWISPFMMVGMKIRKRLGLPGLHIKTNSDSCIHCKKCTKACPMSLPVEEYVKDGEITELECIQCGKCIDSCPKKALCYTMSKQKTK